MTFPVVLYKSFFSNVSRSARVRLTRTESVHRQQQNVSLASDIPSKTASVHIAGGSCYTPHILVGTSIAAMGNGRFLLFREIMYCVNDTANSLGQTTRR
jgi:hypothetical protein